MRNSLRILFLLGLVLAGTITLVMANPPAVPAGSTPSAVPAAPAPGATSQAAAQPAQQQPGPMGMVLPFALMFGVVYFLMIRPQQKKMKEQQKMMSELQIGDEVVTSSGILGKIAGIAEKVITVEVATNVKIKILKSQIAQVLKGQTKELS